VSAPNEKWSACALSSSPQRHALTSTITKVERQRSHQPGRGSVARDRP
jgi:hypothetical protein